MYHTQHSMNNNMQHSIQGNTQNMLSDQIIASDLLNGVKTSIKESAAALTETVSPEVHRTLEQQLSQALRFHEQMTHFMVQKGWYKPYNVQQMVQADIQQVQQIQQNLHQQATYQGQQPQHHTQQYHQHQYR